MVDIPIDLEDARDDDSGARQRRGDSVGSNGEGHSGEGSRGSGSDVNQEQREMLSGRQGGSATRAMLQGPMADIPDSIRYLISFCYKPKGGRDDHTAWILGRTLSAENIRLFLIMNLIALIFMVYAVLYLGTCLHSQKILTPFYRCSLGSLRYYIYRKFSTNTFNSAHNSNLEILILDQDRGYAFDSIQYGSSIANASLLPSAGSLLVK